MKIYQYITVALAVVATAALSSCDDTKSYAERLTDENMAINSYLSNYRVYLDIPEDTMFITGTDAPFYRLDDEGNFFMQVLRPGDRKNNKVKDDQMLYFRFTRWNLNYLYNYGELLAEGNSTDMEYMATSFRFGNENLPSTTQYGVGIQMPLHYLGIDCEVNLIVKSRYGFQSDISTVSPYLYNLRYFVPMSN